MRLQTLLLLQRQLPQQIGNRAHALLAFELGDPADTIERRTSLGRAALRHLRRWCRMREVEAVLDPPRADRIPALSRFATHRLRANGLYDTLALPSDRSLRPPHVRLHRH
jgi:hypothetical protein